MAVADSVSLAGQTSAVDDRHGPEPDACQRMRLWRLDIGIELRRIRQAASLCQSTYAARGNAAQQPVDLLRSDYYVRPCSWSWQCRAAGMGRGWQWLLVWSGFEKSTPETPYAAHISLTPDHGSDRPCLTGSSKFCRGNLRALRLAASSCYVTTGLSCEASHQVADLAGRLFALGPQDDGDGFACQAR